MGELEGMENQYVYFLNFILLSYVLSKWLNLLTIWYINNDMESDDSSTQGGQRHPLVLRENYWVVWVKMEQKLVNGTFMCEKQLSSSSLISSLLHSTP